MQEVCVLLNSVDRARTFVNTVTKFESNMNLVTERRVVDAKSIMGVFSCDLSKPLTLIIHSDDDAILKSLRRYIEN